MDHRVVAGHPLENVRQRQQRQAFVLLGDRKHQGPGPNVGGDVAVRQHHAFGVARRARGIDDRGEVLGPDGEGPDPPRCEVDRACLAVLLERRERHHVGAGEIGVKTDHPFERGQLAPDGRDLGVLGRRGDEDGPGTRVLEQVVNLPGGEGRIDRHVDREGGEGGEIGQGPLGPVFREDGHPVPRGDA